jgi:hypothetical protein
MTSFNDEAHALHVATYSGWYRFEQRDGQWAQTEKALSFWKLTSLQVDPNESRHIYAATEHSGLFVSNNGGAEWQRAKPNVPRLTTNSLLALPGRILAGTVPAALYSASNGGAHGESWKGSASAPPAAASRRARSWERACASSPRTMKRHKGFSPPSR